MTLRCLMVCWEYPPLVEGGLGRHVGALAPALAAGGVEVHVLTRHAGRRLIEEEAAGVVVHRLPQPRRPDDMASFLPWVERMNDDILAAGRRLARRVPFDLLHGHDWLLARAGESLADRLGRPLVMTIHATEHGRHRGWVAAEPESRIHAAERRAVARAERLIVCSSYMRGHLVDALGAAPDLISVVPNGVEDASRRPPGDLRALRARWGAPAEKLILLAGRLVYEKGFQLAIEALPVLLDRVGEVRLLIAGAGIQEDELRAAAEERGLGAQVSFLGWMGPDTLDSLYAVSDVCLVPSIYEPFGLVALEAMARGCPCVVADTGGLREVVPHGEVGLRFRTRDPAGLAGMVELVLGDRPLRERMAAAARRHAAGFTWATMAERTADIYREACRARTPAAGIATMQT